MLESLQKKKILERCFAEIVRCEKEDFDTNHCHKVLLARLAYSIGDFEKRTNERSFREEADQIFENHELKDDLERTVFAIRGSRVDKREKYGLHLWELVF